MNSTTSLMSPCSGTTSNSSILRRSTSRVQEIKCASQQLLCRTHTFGNLAGTENLYLGNKKIHDLKQILPLFSQPGLLDTLQLSNIRSQKVFKLRF